MGMCVAAIFLREWGELKKSFKMTDSHHAMRA